jgi:hypothetical protein
MKFFILSNHRCAIVFALTSQSFSQKTMVKIATILVTGSVKTSLPGNVANHLACFAG